MRIMKILEEAPMNLSAKEAKFIWLFTLHMASRKNSPVMSEMAQERIKKLEQGKAPPAPISTGMPSMPTPIDVPKIKKQELRKRRERDFKRKTLFD